MTSVVRAPWTSPAQMLRPRESVPKGCSAEGMRNGWATISKGWYAAISGAAVATSTTSPSHARPPITRGFPKKRCQKVFTRPP